MESLEFSSPFTHVLDTNYAPTADERLKISTLLHSPEQRLRILEEEISKLQAERDKLQSFIDRHRQLLSPFRRLPADVWREVFVRCLPENVYRRDAISSVKGSYPGRSLQDAPLLLTIICHSWREIAFETPRLWNGLHVYLPRFHPEVPEESFFAFVKARKEGVERWLDRSGALPIRFSLTFGSPSAMSPLPRPLQDARLVLAADFMQLISHYSHKLQTLALSRRMVGALPFNWQSLVELTQNEKPVLETIHLSGGFLSDEFDARTPVAALLTQSRSLQSVHLESEHLQDFLTLDINWSSITELHITSPIDYHDPAEIIPRIGTLCRSLTVLHLEINSELSANHVITPVSLPDLRKLQLSLSWYGDGSDRVRHDSVQAALQCLEAPRLSCFALVETRYNMERDTVDTMPFYGLFARCGSGITKLTVGGEFMGEPERLLNSLELLPSLLSLHLKARRNHHPSEMYYLSDARPLLSALAIRPTSCSLLEELQVDGCAPDHIDAIIAFSSARPRLKSLSVDFGTIDKKDVQEMESDRVLTTLANLRKVKGAQVHWTWKEGVTPVGYFDHPYAGLDGYFDAKPFLGLLAIEPIPCPLLEELGLDGCGADHVDAIIAFTSARPRLKALSVKFGTITDKAGLQIMKSDRILATLKDLRERKGVRIDWTWYKGPMADVVFDHPYAGLDGRLVEWDI
ncbi:hypothetical protein PQX77_010327 [Marasmius sp. AFHP31]|nr:hypothetical protein PQX77_010327 [Marasmius sp. AFHP31]